MSVRTTFGGYMQYDVGHVRSLLVTDLRELRRVIDTFLKDEELQEGFARIALSVSEAYQKGKPLLVAGNGGSNAEAAHLAGELVAGFEDKGRRGLRALAIPSNMSITTAWVNDADYQDLMVREVDTWGEEGGVLLLLSTSGESENQVRAAKRAHGLGMTVCSWLGKTGGRLAPLSHTSVIVPSMKTSRIQEMHLPFLHVLCRFIDEVFAPV